jgi:hypothetical protein
MRVIGGIKIGRGNRSTGRKPAPTPLFPPEVPNDIKYSRMVTKTLNVGIRSNGADRYEMLNKARMRIQVLGRAAFASM